MKVKSPKIYSLSNERYIVSYFDPVRKIRVQKNFLEEEKAKQYLNALKAPSPSKSELSYLRTASTDSAVRIFLEQVQNSSFSKSGKLIREFLDFFSLHGVPRLTESNLHAFFTQIKNEHDYSDRTLLIIKSRLQGFFKFLTTHKAIEVSPLDGIKFNRGAPYKRKPILLSENAINEFIEKAKNLSPALFYPIFLFINETAAKTADILALQWKDIQFKANTIGLVRSKEVQPRSFQVSDDLLQALRKIDRVSDHVFTSLEGQPFKKYILGRELKRFQKCAGYPTDWGLRDLRASYGLNFLKRGGNTRELQKIMGHIRPYQTEEIYGRYNQLISNLKGPAAVQESGTVSSSDNEFGGF